MDTTAGGSGGIPQDPSLETGRDEEERLNEWRLKLWTILETGTALEQTREEKIITKVFFQKIRRYKEGKGEGKEKEFGKIPRLEENADGLYDWLILLMIYIYKMVNWDWDVEKIRTSMMKVVIQIAAILAERKGTERLTIPKQGSGEEYAKRVIEFIEGIREEKKKKEKRRQTKMEWNIFARAFHPQEKKGEQKKHERRDECEILKLYPKGGVMVINGTQLSDKNAERNVEKVWIQEKEVEQDRLEENVNQQKDKEEEIIGRRR